MEHATVVYFRPKFDFRALHCIDFIPRMDFREKKCDGINGIRRLAFHHPDIVCSQLHSIVLAIVAEVGRCISRALTPLLFFILDWLLLDWSSINFFVLSMPSVNDVITECLVFFHKYVCLNCPPRCYIAVKM
jgi:hypothetical protein